MRGCLQKLIKNIITYLKTKHYFDAIKKISFVNVLNKNFFNQFHLK